MFNTMADPNEDQFQFEELSCRYKELSCQYEDPSCQYEDPNRLAECSAIFLILCCIQPGGELWRVCQDC